MSYPVELRKRAVAFHESGHSLRETAQTFDVAISTIQSWRKLLRECGTLKPRPNTVRPFKKIDPERLAEILRDRPDLYLREIADVFGCCVASAYEALKRLGYTRKKKRHLRRAVAGEGGGIPSRNDKH